ncbi:MAG: hypothetical protein CBB87_00480 [Micavibrio sp. TMED27]|nr:hypothetical protein [Micavibrio sp.]OUT92950.1 MAG: hypothetical protein CBB87_00480 [Micavibrio sp. TMED27]|tara:strand:+ start:490 stop:1236 length:747 start_codon:yes stop_codon:yes gene_type:complete
MSTYNNEVADNVFRLGNEYFNFYLIRDGREFTLIDAGFPGFLGQVESLVRKLGGSLGDIRAILITHAHLDHVGFASTLKKTTGCPIYAHSLDDKRLRCGGAQIPPWGLLLNAWRPHPIKMLATAVLNNVFFGPSIREYIPFKQDGETLDVPGKSQVIFTPGHTFGSVSFWLPDRKVLFAGDALVTINMLTGKKGKPQITPRLTEDDRQQVLQSLNKYKDLGDLTLLTGHGDPWTGDIACTIETLQTDI